MKHTLTMVFCVLLLAFGVNAYSITASFTPQTVQVNVLNTASFDPYSPDTQPILSYLQIRNDDAEAYQFNMEVKVFWNSLELSSIGFTSIESIPANSIFPMLSNRDLITNATNAHFSHDSGDFDFDTIFSRNAILKEALQSGYFPDGNLYINVKIKPVGTDTWSAPAILTINVRNAGTIFLSYPGKPLGSNPPKIDMKPVTFLWNSTSTGFNYAKLKIKEFPPNYMPNQGNIETSGALFYETTGMGTNENTFSDFLSFQENYYYAWQISINTFDEHNPSGSANPSGMMKSSWYVFRYVSNASDDNSLEVMAALNMLNNDKLRKLFNSGYTPTGVVVYEGKVFTGKEALDLINTLSGVDIEVEIKN